MLVNKLQASHGIKYFYLNLSLISLQDKNESFVQHFLGINESNIFVKNLAILWLPDSLFNL